MLASAVGKAGLKITRCARETGADLIRDTRVVRLATAEGQPVSIEPRDSQGGRPETEAIK